MSRFPESAPRRIGRSACLVMAILVQDGLADDQGPKPDERQLPTAMHSAMSNRPKVTVGREGCDLNGADNRVLQAAVDYVAGLGGGLVEIGEGEFLMRDSLHLRSDVTVRGLKGKTILRKSNGVTSSLAIDGDFGEQQVTVSDPKGFSVGVGVAIWDDNAGGFHTTVARITGTRGNTFSIDTPLGADCMVSNHAKAATVFPVVSGSNIERARVEDLVIEGSRETNPPLNGCRGAGIYLYRGFGTMIQGCVVRGYSGDGISFQQSNDVEVVDCLSENNADLGFHPGSGSQRPVLRNNLARSNGTDGLFLCWRVRHGLFENNRFECNGRFGISIGHKDSDNLLRQNHISGNGQNGVFFRNEEGGMAPHRNRLEANVIENNGRETGTAGVRVRGEPSGLIFRDNVIRDTREGSDKTQTIGIRVEDRVGPVEIETNLIDADTTIEDHRVESFRTGSPK
ncbi:right-handed parallel beta-helix repeat-containing protein [Tundrisphaera lichenicola]|uniref:right-handed parallel beta-helix repeat-containing protein n=1 Tax=Tundrisphaera lichenicola TaxID=2029860 RepID=UPI003EC02D0A